MTGTFTTSNGTWSVTHVLRESSDERTAPYALKINDDKTSANIQFPPVNGCGTVSFYYRNPHSGEGTFALQKSTNGGSSWTTLTTQIYSSSASYSYFSHNVNDASCGVIIRILSDDNTGHLCVDDISVGTYGSPSCGDATWNGSASGDWNDPLNWSTGSVPISTQNVVIPSSGWTNPLSIFPSAACASLTVEGSASTSVLSFDAGNSITCIAFTIGTSGVYGMYLGSGTITVNGDMTWNGKLEIGANASLDVNGSITLGSGMSENISGGHIYCSGNFDATNGSNFTPSGGTFTFDGSSVSALDLHSSANFNDLVINKSSSSTDLNLDDDLDVNGDLTVTSGDIDGDDDYDIYVSGSISLSTSSDLYDIDNLYFDGTGTVTTSAINDAGLDVYISKTSGSVTTAGDLTFDQLYVNDAGSLIIDGETVSVDNNNGITISSGTIQITSGLLHTKGGYSADFTLSGGTLDVDGGEVRIGDLSDADPEFVFNSGTLDISGGTVNIGAELDMANGTINLSGGVLNIGASTAVSGYGTSGEHTFDADAGTINLSGGSLNILRQYPNTSTEAIDIYSSVVINSSGGSTISFGRGSSTTEDLYLDINGSKTFINFTVDAGSYKVISKEDLDVNGDLTISSGYLSGDNDEDIRIAGNLSTHSSDVIIDDWEDIYFDGSTSVNCGAFSDLGIDLNISSGTVTATGNIDANQIIVSSGATFNVSTTNFTNDNTVNIDGTLQITSGSFTTSGNTDVDGTLTISTGTYDGNGSFDVTNGNLTFTDAGMIKLSGNVTSLGTFTRGTGKIEFDGSGSQNLPSQDLTVNNFEIDNSSGITLAGDITVEGTLTLTNGDITSSSSNKLSIKSTVSGGSASSHIVGPVDFISSSTNECTIPVGNGTVYSPMKIQRDGGSSTTYTVEYKNGAPTTLDWASNPEGLPLNSSNVTEINHDYYVDVSRTSGSANAYISLYFGDFSSVPSSSDQYLLHWDGSEWDEMSVTSRSGNYVKSLATSFSPFGQGSGGSALPIDLVSFTAACENNETELEFVVASQINNDYFSIYRSNNTTTDWNLVGEIEGAGNTSTQLTYKWIDNNPLSGVSYYKLTQTDYDGTSETFSPIAVMCENAPLDGYSVYPNPANEILNIDLDLENYQGNDVHIEVIDINGKIIQLQQVQLNRGYNHMKVDLSNIRSGVYLIKFIRTRDYIKEFRVIKH